MDNLISREAAIKAVDSYFGTDPIVEKLKHIPLIALEWKKGKWIPGKELSREYSGDVLVGINYEDWHCSSCGVVVEEPIKPKWKFCPNCGAKMDGVSE